MTTFRIPRLVTGILSLAFLGACSDAPAPAGDAPAQQNIDAQAAVAQYAGGEVSIAATLERVAEDRNRGRSLPECSNAASDMDGLVDCYRETASDIALAGLLEIDGTLSRLIAEDEGLEDQRTAYLVSALTRKLASEAAETIDDGQVAAHYETHEEQYVQPGSVVLWNILRRNDDAYSADANREVLAEVRQRFEGGETFAALAKEYSQSENRLRNGYVGPVTRGRMAPALEEAAFALEPGEISAPIEVPGGLVMLHVSDATPGLSLDLDAAAPAIRRQLVAEAVEDRLDVLRADVPTATVLEVPTLIGKLKAADGDDTVLEVGDVRRTRNALLERAGLDSDSDIDANAELIERVYETEKRYLQVSHWARSDAEGARALRDEAREDLERLARLRAVDAWAEAAMAELVDADPERIDAYFADNRSRYQSPLRFVIRALEIPLSPDAPMQMARLDALTSAQISEQLLDMHAAEFGGSVVDHGELTFDEFRGIYPHKAAELIVQTEPGHAAPPFQQDEKLHLLWLVERMEAAPLELEQAREEVRADYLRRFAKQLSRQVREARLREAGFTFHAERIRAFLAPPGPADSSTS